MTTDVENNTPTPAAEAQTDAESPHVAGAINNPRELLEEIETD